MPAANESNALNLNQSRKGQEAAAKKRSATTTASLTMAFSVKSRCAWSSGAPSVISRIKALFQPFCPFYIDLSLYRVRGKCH
jgi:hypothetical protein